MKTKIQNPTNAFVVVEADGEKIAIDPWLSDGIYLNTWHNFPRVPDLMQQDLLSDVDYCLISHLHKDHFNIETIK